MLGAGLAICSLAAQAQSLPDLSAALAVQPEAMPGCAAPIADGGEWAFYGHDLADTRYQPLEQQIGPDTISELTTHYVFDTQSYQTVAGDDTPRAFNGPFYNTPSVADGCVYSATTDGTVFAINADTGALVWENDIEDGPGYSNGLSGGGNITGSVYVDQNRNRIYVLVTLSGDPYVAALDQATGTLIWKSPSATPDLAGDPEPDDTTYTLSGAIVFEDVVMVPFGGNAETQRYYQGGVTFYDANDGHVLKISNLFTLEDYNNNFSGGSIWATGAIDAVNKYMYIGTGNPGASTRESPLTNAILKMDVDRSRASFGEIVAHYKGDNDHYMPGTEPIDDSGCYDLSGNLPYPGNSALCAQFDLDFGASPNLFYAPDGRLLVGNMQKSGKYHVADAETMAPEWTSIVGTPCFPCNTATSAVVDGQVLVVGAPPRTMFALREGQQEWAMPITAPGIHYQAVSAANGLAYTYDGAALHAFDTATGLLRLRLLLDPESFAAFPDQATLEQVLGGNFSHPLQAALLSADSSGIAIARNTLFVAAGNRIYALRLARSAGADGDVDGDGIANADDNCAGTPNAAQEDRDGDGMGDACDDAPSVQTVGGGSAGPVTPPAASAPDAGTASGGAWGLSTLGVLLLGLLRRRRTLFLALGATLCAFNAQADDGCRDDNTQCGVETDQITLAFPMETRHLALYWELRTDNGGKALDLYKKLVERSGYDMPDKPALMMYSVHLASPYEASPGYVTRYNEGNLMMRVKLKQPGYPEEDGWYNLYMPVDDRGAYDSAQEYGYPKYLATVENTWTPATGVPDTVVSQATLEDGRVTTRIEFTRDDSAPYSDDLDNVARFGDFQYSLAPAHRGPERVRTRLSTTNSMPPPGQGVSNEPYRGYAHVVMDDYPQSWDAFNPRQIGDLFHPGEALSTLVDFTQDIPAAYVHQQMVLVFTIDRMGPRPGFTPPPGSPGDQDGDEVPDEFDNCADRYNPQQTDADHDGIGDACEDRDDNNATAGVTAQCPGFNEMLPQYPQQDGLCGLPATTIDAILLGGIEGFCGAFIGAPGFDAICRDTDMDGIYDRLDNCPADANPDQADLDGDEIGDVCDWADDSDDDVDGTVNAKDNCPTVVNYSQADSDGDGIGDACDPTTSGTGGTGGTGGSGSTGGTGGPELPAAEGTASGGAFGSWALVGLLLFALRRRPT